MSEKYRIFPKFHAKNGKVTKRNENDSVIVISSGSDQEEKKTENLNVKVNLNAKGKSQKAGRYFNLLQKESSEKSFDGQDNERRPETSNANVKKKEINGRKRKKMSCETSDYISLLSDDDSEEPSTKQPRMSSDSITESNRKNEPFTRLEAEELFIKDFFSCQIQDFYESNCQQEHFLLKKQQLRSALEKCIRRVGRFSYLTVHLVGSSVSGFGRLTSDADYCVVVDQNSESIRLKNKALNILYTIRNIICGAPFVRNLMVIPAKVPILKFQDVYSRMECDLNINNLTGLRNTELMKAYSRMDPRVQPLALCIKEWAHQRGINDASKGTLSSYSLLLMIIHFLQSGVQPQVVPCLHARQAELFDVKIPIHLIEKKAASVKSHRSTNRMTLSELLRKFFEYYATKFNFVTGVISVRLGRVMSIYECCNSNLFRDKSLKIEEPFDKSNVSRAVFNKDIFEEIIEEFRRACSELKRTSDLRSIISMK